MPELLEIQTTAEKLKPIIIKPILDIKSSEHLQHFFRNQYNFNFNNNVLIKSKITDLIRHGKKLFFKVKNKNKIFYLESQFGMTGSWLTFKEFTKKKHVHLQIKFKDLILGYQDPRRFGRFYLLTEQEFIDKTNAPDPFNCSDGFNLQWLHPRIIKTSRAIKSILLDQNIFPGIGNYLASEILFSAKILPTTKGVKLSKKQISKICTSTKSTLKRLYKYGGLSLKDYYQPDGMKGTVKGALKTYLREDQNCLRKNCKGVIKKVYIQKRVTYYCPECQK